MENKKKRGRKPKYDWSKWDPTKTIKENAQNLGIPYVYCRRDVYRQNLSFKKSPFSNRV